MLSHQTDYTKFKTTLQFEFFHHLENFPDNSKKKSHE
jgi:hypothetical protein